VFTPLFKLLPLPLKKIPDDDDSDDTEEDERGDTLNNDNKTGGRLGEVKKEKE